MSNVAGAIWLVERMYLVCLHANHYSLEGSFTDLVLVLVIIMNSKYMYLFKTTFIYIIYIYSYAISRNLLNIESYCTMELVAPHPNKNKLIFVCFLDRRNKMDKHGCLLIYLIMIDIRRFITIWLGAENTKTTLFAKIFSITLS